MKLDILMCHYKEPAEQIKIMLDSINNQPIDFQNIQLIIFNDGDELILDNNLFKLYKYKITYKIFPRQGVSKLRNKLINTATSDYIWFLDPDDYLEENVLDKVLIELDKNPDVLFVGSNWERQYGGIRKFIPNYQTFSILGCNILKRQFLIDNNLYADESIFLAGDVLLENLPKFYTNNCLTLREYVLHYCYHATSVIHDKNNNGWSNDYKIAAQHIIERLISDKKYNYAYQEFLRFVFTYNSKYIHDTFCEKFKELNLYDINYRLDLR